HRKYADHSFAVVQAPAERAHSCTRRVRECCRSRPLCRPGVAVRTRSYRAAPLSTGLSIEDGSGTEPSPSGLGDLGSEGGVVMKVLALPITALLVVSSPAHAATMRQPLHATGVAPGARGKATFAMKGTPRRGRRGNLHLLARSLPPGKTF